MVVKISKKASKTEIKKALIKFKDKQELKGFRADKYFGKMVRGFDGLAYQKEARNEWD